MLHSCLVYTRSSGSSLVSVPNQRKSSYADWNAAAFFVQTTVTSYENHYAQLEAAEEDSDGKECSNLIVLLSELYNFQVVSCVLVFDIIRGLLQDEFTEFKIELLLKITRSAFPYRGI